tara:strand:+ start:1623 stop:2027 length:405 start_codon:yes stop_codon:yes gene_type:complete
MELNYKQEDLEEKQENPKTFSSLKDLLMFYNTTLRNVGLFTTISFAALGYSRFYRGKSKLYSAGMIVISLIFLLIAFSVNMFLYNTVQEYSDIDEFNGIQKWRNLTIIVIILQSVLTGFALYTLYRILTNNKFS